MPFENLPYTNFHELNTDWMIEKLGDLNQYVIQAKDYADAAALSEDAAAAKAEAAASSAHDAHEDAQAAADSAALAAQTVEDLEDDFQELSDEVDSLRLAAINPYDGKNLYVFGDSNAHEGTIGTTVKTMLNMAHVYNYSENGASFIYYGDTVIEDELNSVASPDNDAALVICIGGINDLHYSTYNVSTFKDAVSSFITAARAKFPNANICMVFDSGRQLPNKLELDYERAMMQAGSGAKLFTLPTADMCLDLGLFTNQNHWNDAGKQMIADRICTMLAGGSPALCTGRNQHTAYNANNPSQYGNHRGFVTNVLTEIDPYKMERVDHIKVYITASFASDSETLNYLCTLPGCYQYGDTHLGAAEGMRAVYAHCCKSSGGVVSTKEIAFVYNPYSMNSVTDDPQLRLETMYQINVSDLTGWVTTLTFDTYTGYVPAD